MNSKLKNILVFTLILAFIALTVGLLIPDVPVAIIFSLYIITVIGIQFLGLSPAAFTLTFFSILMGVFSMNRLPQEQIMLIPMLIITLIICVSVLHVHLQKLVGRVQRGRSEGNSLADETYLIEKEMDYYNQRKDAFLARSGQRRHLVQAAKEMGSLLDTTAIQQKLIETAQLLFPGRSVKISYGQNADSVDNYVIQKKQPIVVPTGPSNASSIMAAPVRSQSQVAAILRVAGSADSRFSRDELRLLDILASLASLALDNTALFTQVQETALRDGLTGLLTHRAFQDHLEAQILEASRFGHSLSVILSDVDHFKMVNDKHGHQAGDQALQGFAHVIYRSVRDVDIVARYGGEEFVVLLLQTQHEDAVRMAEQIRRDLESQEFDVGSKSLSITGSFGVATFPADATSAQQLMRQADQRLYKAKRGGRNRVIGR